MCFFAYLMVLIDLNCLLLGSKTNLISFSNINKLRALRFLFDDWKLNDWKVIRLGKSLRKLN